MIKKPKLTEQIFEQEVINALSSESSEIHRKSNFYELLQTKYTCTKAYTLKWWDIYYNKHITATNEALTDAVVTEKVKAFEMGLKSKTQRLIELQKQYNEIDVILENGITDAHTFANGELITGIRPLNALEIAKLHLTIKEIRAEISKIEGDYATSKIDLTTEGKAITNPIFGENPLLNNLKNNAK